MRLQPFTVTGGRSFLPSVAVVLFFVADRLEIELGALSARVEMGSTQAPSGFVAFPALSSSSFDGSLVGRRGKSVLTANAAACDLCRPRDSRMQLASPQTQIGRPKTSIKKNVGNVNAPQQPEPESM